MSRHIMSLEGPMEDPMEEQWLLRHAVVDATVASSQFAKKTNNSGSEEMNCGSEAVPLAW